MRVTAVVICFLFLLSGCGGDDTNMERALSLRTQIQSSKGCTFHTVISADYGDEIYVFEMDCQTDADGNMNFKVTEPVSISGITGTVGNDGGKITFDNQVLMFQTIADDQITPVTAPWLLIKTLRSGYIKGCAKVEQGLQIMIDDSYAENPLHLNIGVGENNLPVSGEIFWQGRRIMTLSVEEFSFL